MLDNMLFERTNSKGSPPDNASSKFIIPHNPKPEQPLTCMFYFFASQMKHNIQSADPDLVRRNRLPNRPTHRLDNLLARIGMHAAYSPLIADFQTYPIDVSDALGDRKDNLSHSREVVHDTVLLMKFRNRRAREEWIATQEWQDFMQKANADPPIFRRMPHVRCASSIKGLMDPIDILTS